MKHKVFLVAVLIAMFMPFSAKASYTFSAVAPSGQTLYYTLTSYQNGQNVDPHLIVSYPGDSWQNPWADYEKPTGVLVVPDSVTYQGFTYPVISINNRSFEGCSGLTSVVLPNTIISIDHNAFNGCSGMTSIVLPNSITNFGSSTLNSSSGKVFANCTSLTSIVLPDSLEWIREGMFENCSNLSSITLPSKLYRIDKDAFKNCSSLTSITIPESLQIYGDNIFYGCSSLETIYFNAIQLNGVYSSNLGRLIYLFSGCTSLNNVVFGNSVTTIPAAAFLNCTGITSITLPNSVTVIGTEAFKGCSSLTSITIPEGVTTIGQSAFENCSSLSSVTLPESLTVIEQAAFRMCATLTSLTIGDNVTEIPANTFAGCSSLTIALSNSVRNIRNYAFQNVPTVHYCGTATGSPWGALNVVPCYTEDSLIYLDSTKTVLTGSDANIHVANIPSTVVRIDVGAFNNRQQLSSVTIPSTVTHIGKSAFGGCGALNTITIPNNITTIKEGTFLSCVNLHTVNLPTQLEIIGKESFKDCALSSINLPNTLHTIGNDAFRNCPLTAITIPESVVEIGTNVFRGSGVQTIYFNAREVLTNYTCYYGSGSYGSYNATNIFSGCNSLRTIVLGDSVKRIPAYMFATLTQVNSLTHLTLPPNLKYIGDGAFMGCSQIVDATIPEGVDTLGQKIFEGCLALRKVTFNALHAESTGVPSAPILAYRRLTCGTLSNCNSSGVGVTYILADHLPAYDTIIIGPNVENIPNYAFGLVYADNNASQLDSLSYFANTKVINNSTKLRHIGAGAFGNMRVHEFDFGDSLKTIDMCAFIGNPIRKAFLPEGTIIVADGAFNNCHSLDSVSLPSTLQILGTDCFSSTTALRYLHYDCENARTYSFTGEADAINTPFGTTPNLHEVSFGPHVRGLNAGTFSNANGLQRLVIPEGVEYLENDLCKMRTSNSGSAGGYYPMLVAGSNLSYVEFPASLISIGPNAFSTTPVDTVVCRGSDPAWIGNVFNSDTKNYGLLKVPCGSISAYSTEEEWMDFSNITEYMPHDITLTVNVDTMGTVASACTGTYSNGRPGVRLTATPATQHRFVQWSDGVTVNPRVIYLGSDTAFEAQFAWGLLYTVNAYTSNSTRGSVTGSGTFVQNTVDTLTATSNYGYHFTQWSDGDTTNPRLLTVTSNTTLTAIFQPNQYALEVFSADATQGTVSGGGTYTYNTNHQIHATPTTGYHFDHWNDNLGSTPRTIHLTGDTAFTAFFAINVYTLNVSPANATMGSASADTNRYPHGSIATLTATPNYGYHFTQWSDGDTTNPRLYTMTQNKTLTAQFAINQYSVNLSVDTVRGNVFGGGNYNYLTGITIEATPKYGYHFVSWSDGDTNRLRSLTVTADTTIEALFQPNLYTVNVYCAIPYMGTIFIDSFGTDTSVTLPYLDTVTLTAIPNYGYHFSQWADGDTTNPRQVVVTGNRLIGAFFELNQYTVTLTATHGSVSGSGTYYYNTDITIEAIPDYGYHFSAWSDGNTDNPRDLTMTQDTSLEALFLPNQYTLTLHSADTTLGHTYGSGVYNYLDTVQFGVTDIAPHYHFAYWGDADNVQFSTDSSGLLVIYEDNTFIANFAPDQYTLTLAANNDNYGTVFGSGSYNYGSQITISATPNYGYYFVRWDNGETANPLSFSVLSDTTVTAIFAPELTADLCMVSVENGRNTLIWNGEPTAERYQVFRESSVASQYELLAELDAQESFSWVDNDSWPETRSYRYRLEAVDQYGATFYGAPHKTMHLTINRGQGTNWNLAWTEYEGTYFVTYIIYRGTSPENIEEINRMSVGGNTSYTDVNPPAGDLYYQVGIVPANPCQSYQSKSSDVILSNIANSGSVGISEPESTDNPIRITTSLGQIVVEGVEGLEVRVFDVMGRRIPELEIHHSEFKIDVPASGVYIVKIGNLPAHKVVVIK